MAKKLQIPLVRGTVGTTQDQLGSVRSLGLKRRMQTVVKTAHPSILGMIEKCRHLLEIKEIDG